MTQTFRSTGGLDPMDLPLFLTHRTFSQKLQNIMVGIYVNCEVSFHLHYININAVYIEILFYNSQDTSVTPNKFV